MYSSSSGGPWHNRARVLQAIDTLQQGGVLTNLQFFAGTAGKQRES
jgi:hypothetical protein